MLKKDFFSGVGRGSKVYFKVPTSTSRPIDPRMYRTNANHDMATDIGIWTTDDYKMIVTKQLHANYKISPVLQILNKTPKCNSISKQA